MSLDSGIYIGAFKDQFRVILTTAIENIQYDPDTEDGFNKKAVRDYFGNGKSCDTEKCAMKIAIKKYRENSSKLEYGINIINFRNPFNYYT